MDIWGKEMLKMRSEIVLNKVGVELMEKALSKKKRDYGDTSVDC